MKKVQSADGTTIAFDQLGIVGDEARAQIRSRMPLSVKLKTSKPSSPKRVDRHSCSVSPPAQLLPWRQPSNSVTR